MTAYHQLSAISRLLTRLRPISILQDPSPTLPYNDGRARKRDSITACAVRLN
jgi:hypothetical protein